LIVLALDTALDGCSVAIADGEIVRAWRDETMTRGQAERLAPMVRETLEAAGIRFSELDRVAVTTGPGSFTGVRVGLSFARALALSLNKSCLGVSTLEALAFSPQGARREEGADCEGPNDGGPNDGGPSDGGPSDGGPSDGNPSDGGPNNGFEAERFLEQGLRGAVIETPGASYAALYEDGAALIAPRAIERGKAGALFGEAAKGRAITVVGPLRRPDVRALALRAQRLDLAVYPSAPTYLRAPHVTPPSGSGPRQ
jgi:tRNA threonylcarbamoyladenosine biosynthesis protein TsaB